MTRRDIIKCVRLPQGLFFDGRGFTIVEMLVVFAIVTLVSGMVLVSFSGVHERTDTARSGQELALVIRRAQNMSLAVASITPGDVPPAVGVQARINSGDYFMFADMNANGIYDAGDILVRPGDLAGDYMMQGGVKIRSLTSYVDTTSHAQSVVDIMFAAPEAATTFTDDAGGTLGDRLEIQLSPPSGKIQRTITVRTSGQISIQ